MKYTKQVELATKAISEMGFKKTKSMTTSLTVRSISYLCIEWLHYSKGIKPYNCEISPEAMRQAMINTGFKHVIGKYGQWYFNVSYIPINEAKAKMNHSHSRHV